MRDNKKTDECLIFKACPESDLLCVSDYPGYGARMQLHQYIDDDRDGILDRFESDEVTLITKLISHALFIITSSFSGCDFNYVFFYYQFLRDELNCEDGHDRHSTFHGADDHISVNDLWKLWTNSPGKRPSNLPEVKEMVKIYQSLNNLLHLEA